MAWTYGFFNSVGGDRKYNAEQMSEIFEGLITQGVYESIGKKLAVQPNNGMTVQINTGRGWFGGRWVKNDAEYTQTLEAADVLLNRYCAVCIRVDSEENARTAAPYFKYSEFATNPVKPTMERTETVQEYCLAYIYIKANATEITAADIEDTRADRELCGWVTGLIEQLDTDTLWAQWQAQWENFMDAADEQNNDRQTQWEAFMNAADAENDTWQAEQRAAFLAWYSGIQDFINDDAEMQLTSDVVRLKTDVADLKEEVASLPIPEKYTGIFDGLGWESNDDGVYTQTVAVEGITADDYIIVTPTAEFKDTYIAMGCAAISQADNAITFSSTAPQDVNMTIEVLVINT